MPKMSKNQLYFWLIVLVIGMGAQLYFFMNLEDEEKHDHDDDPPAEQDEAFESSVGELIKGDAFDDKIDLTVLDAMNQWGNLRGPLYHGVAPNAKPPLSWAADKNIKWKRAIEGRGFSTPIVWGNRIYITTAVPYGEELEAHSEHADGAHDNMEANRKQKFMIICLSRSDGELIWKRVLRDQRPHEGTHETGSWASNSCVTDGKRLVVSFGSQGVYGLDMNGHLLWEKDLGNMQTKHGHGEGSSPALYKDAVNINWDHEGQSFILAIKADTGKEIWRKERDEVTSWSTPIVIDFENKTQVIVAATKRIRSYDISNGELIWECGGLSGNVVASPIFDEGMLYCMSSYDTRALLAIKLAGAKGDITDSDHIIWSTDKYTSYVPSPLLYNGKLYYIRHLQPWLSSVEAKTGKPYYLSQRLLGITGNVFASPMGADNRIYLACKNGTTLVIYASVENFNVLSTNVLDDSFTSSPVAVDNQLILRGEHFLYVIENSNQ